MDLRKIDALVAKHVMGCEVEDSDWGPFCRCAKMDTYPFTYPHGIVYGNTSFWIKMYSGDVRYAWEVLEKLFDRDPCIAQWGEDDGTTTYWVDFEGTNVPAEDSTDGPLRHRNIAMAICLAALKAVGIEVDLNERASSILAR